MKIKTFVYEFKKMPKNDLKARNAIFYVLETIEVLLT